MNNKVIHNSNDFASCQFFNEKLRISNNTICEKINLLNQTIWSWIWKR